jgi:mycofactocin precursor
MTRAEEIQRMSDISTQAQPKPREAPPVPRDADDEHRAAAPEPPAAELVESDLLVEDVSIDGMCGVY